ncbi:MAG TPA: SRPBCC domain-containing protein [Mucilaginibacter sp.]|jgi:hypothetical protein|nr:SRPBCC domain-containing protein [Mucilaginibacter sp.]
MNDQNFTTTFLVDQTPKVAFDAINDVAAWWTENMEGNSQNLDDEFSVQFADVHYTKQKLIEVVPDKKVVWLVTDSKLTFVENHTEWTSDQIVFEISKQGNQTQVRFTQIGLTPEMQCYNSCFNGWTYYINSLHSLIATGEGQPAKKEIAANA